MASPGAWYSAKSRYRATNSSAWRGVLLRGAGYSSVSDVSLIEEGNEDIDDDDAGGGGGGGGGGGAGGGAGSEYHSEAYTEEDEEVPLVEDHAFFVAGGSFRFVLPPYVDSICRYGCFFGHFNQLLGLGSYAAGAAFSGGGMARGASTRHQTYIGTEHGHVEGAYMQCIENGTLLAIHQDDLRAFATKVPKRTNRRHF